MQELLHATTQMLNQPCQLCHLRPCTDIAPSAQDLKAELGASTQEDADLRSLEDQANSAASVSVAQLHLCSFGMCMSSALVMMVIMVMILVVSNTKVLATPTAAAVLAIAIVMVIARGFSQL